MLRSGSLAALLLGCFLAQVQFTIAQPIDETPLRIPRIAPPTPPAVGGSLYVDSAHVLHYLTDKQDVPLGGASFNGSTTQHWWIGGYGFGQPSGTGLSSDLPNLFVNRDVTSRGGSGTHSALKVSDTVSGPFGLILATTTAAASGQPVIVIQDNPVVVVDGQPISGPGIAGSATIASVLHGTPVSGQATVMLSANTTAPIYSGSPISVGASKAAETEVASSSICSTISDVANANCIGAIFGGAKYSPVPISVWGINPTAADYTGRSSSHSGSTISIEASLVASGPDNGIATGTISSVSGVRFGVEAVATSAGVSGDGPTSFMAGMIARTNIDYQYWDPVTIKYGFYASTMHPAPVGGQITTAFGADGGNVNGLGLFSGTYQEVPQAATPSGRSLTFGYVGIADNAHVSDTRRCIPPGTIVSPGGTVGDAVTHRVMITLSRPVTCTVDRNDRVTFANGYVDGLNFAGYFRDALATMTNADAPGVVRFGSTLNTGIVGSLQIQGRNSAALPVPYGTISGKAVSDTAGAEVGEIDIAPEGAGDVVIGSGAPLARATPKGFPMIPTVDGMPTGVAGANGKAAMVVDTADSKLCFNWGRGWKCTPLR